MRTFDEKVDSILEFTAGKLAEADTNEAQRKSVKTLLGGSVFNTTASTKSLSEDPANFALVELRIYASSSSDTRFMRRGAGFLSSGNPQYLYIRTGESAGLTVTLTRTSSTSFSIKHNGSGNLYVSVTGIMRVAND